MKEHLDDLISKTYTTGRNIKKFLMSGLCALAICGSMKAYAGNDDLDLPIDPHARAPVAERAPQQPQRWTDEDPPTFFGDAIYGARESLIYVIDRSGSMGAIMGPGVDLGGRVRNMTRFQRGQIELKRSIMALAPNIRFNIVSYDCSVNAWQRGLVAASDENKRAAYNWIDGLYPHGGTGTSDGVAYALLRGDDNRDIVLLTDGYPTCNETIPEHRDRIRRCNRNRTRIHVFGIAARGPYRDFCVGVSSDSSGSYHDVR